MSEPLRVLVVEDSADDAELILHELKQEGFELFASRVETAVAMSEALDNGQWGVVLSDYSMPNFSGLGALELLQKKGQDIPFIIVSGKIGEETAVAMMKAGAHDYIMKDNLKRLFSVVQRELQEAAVRKERRRAEAALKESEEKYATLVEQGNDGIIIITDGRIEFANKRMSDITGVPADEVIGKPFIDFVAPADREMVANRHQSRIRGEDVPNNYEIGIVGKNEKIIPVDVNASRINYHGKMADMAILRDITQRKKALEQIENLTRFPDENPSPVLRVQPDGAVTYANAASSALLNLCSGPDETGYANKLPESLQTAVNEAVFTGLNKEVEVAHSGRVFSCLLVPVNLKNYINIYGRDVTERKQMEEALRASEEKYRTMVENLPVGIVLNTIDGRSPDRNRAYMEMHGYISKEEFVRLPAIELYYDPEDRKHFLEKIGEGALRNFEIRHKRKDGSPFWISLSAIPQIGKHGEKLSLVIAQDIDERKRAEEALHLAKLQNEMILNSAGEGILGLDVNGNHTFANQSATGMLGYSVDELLGKPGHALWHHTKADGTPYPETECPVHLAIRSGITKHSDNELFWRKDGTGFPVEYVSTPIKEGEKITGGVLVFTDITERKRAEAALKASEEKFRNLVENAPLGIGITTLDGRPLFRNKAVARMYGFKDVEDLMANSVTTRYNNPEDRKRFFELSSQGMVRDFEAQMKRKDGTSFWMSLTAIPQVTGAGEKQFITIMQDINERKKAQEALKESEEKFQSLVENAPIGITVTTVDGKRVEANRAVLTMHGYESKEEFLETNVADLYAETNERESFMGLLGKGPVQNYELRRKRKDGSVFWASQSSTHFTTSSGEKHLISVIEDISVRRGVEQALRVSEQRFRSLVENLPVGIGVITLTGQTIQRNKTMMEIFGFTDRQEFNSFSVYDLYYDITDRERFVGKVEKGPIKDFEVRLKRHDGSPFWALLNSITQVTPSGEKQRVTVIQDIDDKKKAEAENILKAMLLDTAGDIILLRDMTGKILYINDAACKSYGYTKEEARGMNIRDLLPSGKTEGHSLRNEELLKKGEARFETAHVCKDGTEIPLEVYHRLIKLGEDFAVISIERDISERQRMQEQLMIADRLASIGELASGVAHEVNNPLTSVIGFTELLLERPLPDDVKEDLTTIRTEAQRAAGVVKNLLTFARKHPPSRQPVNLNDIVKKVLELRAYEESINNIQVVTRLALDLKAVMADASQLQQVFFNIMTNAEYFMIETHHKGTLTITTENIDNIVRSSFADDGPGMSAENLAHLFTPFFTTKPVGKGTGLGLSICHGIIASHDGKIYAESMLGAGSTFFVEIPSGSH